MAAKNLLRWCCLHWRGLLQVLTPFLAAFVFLYEEEREAMKCAYVLLIMAVYWIFEVLPVAVTALIPIAAFPLLGVMETVSKLVNAYHLWFL